MQKKTTFYEANLLLLKASSKFKKCQKYLWLPKIPNSMHHSEARRSSIRIFKTQILNRTLTSIVVSTNSDKHPLVDPVWSSATCLCRIDLIEPDVGIEVTGLNPRIIPVSAFCHLWWNSLEYQLASNKISKDPKRIWRSRVWMRKCCSIRRKLSLEHHIC